MPRTIFVPPGGFQGFAEQTLAVKTLVSSRAKPSRRKARTRKTIKRRKPSPARFRAAPPGRRRAPSRKPSTLRKRKKPQRLVKGSAAAKRHMAKLRRMRKR